MTCANNVITVQSSDKIDPTGTCKVYYDLAAESAQKLLDARSVPGGVVNAVATEADTALASYVSPSQRGEILLTRKNGEWVPLTLTRGKINAGRLRGQADATAVRQLQIELPRKM